MVWLKKFSFVIFLVCVFAEAQVSQDFSRSKIKINQAILNVALAQTLQQRNQGLMHVKNWGDVQGMLFIFEGEDHRRFWMKNTLLPLSLGFFDQSGKLLQIEKLNPPRSLAQLKVDSIQSRSKAQYVLEVPQGWFKRNQIQVGAKLWIKGSAQED